MTFAHYVNKGRQGLTARGDRALERLADKVPRSSHLQLDRRPSPHQTITSPTPITRMQQIKNGVGADEGQPAF